MPGGSSPGSTANGGDHGFMVAGGSDSENSYLVEGQETADLAGGFSHTNVPFDFIQEVQVKTSGIEAEHGGSLGGGVNVIMKKGSNGFHGSLFMQFENQALDGSPVAYNRYDPNGNPTPTSGVNSIVASFSRKPASTKSASASISAFLAARFLWTQSAASFADWSLVISGEQLLPKRC